MNLKTQNNIPSSHAVWVAAIEFGAATTKRKIIARIARSNQMASAPG
jgi:hypothetical protein